VRHLLWNTAALLAVILTAGCGCGGGNLDASAPSQRCSLPPNVGKTGSAPHAETGLGADARNYRPLDSGGSR
jgi:hypothetical protein